MARPLGNIEGREEHVDTEAEQSALCALHLIVALAGYIDDEDLEHLGSEAECIGPFPFIDAKSSACSHPPPPPNVAEQFYSLHL
jgi:hypothetical protein